MDIVKICKHHGALDAEHVVTRERGYLRCRFCALERCKTWKKNNPEVQKVYKARTYAKHGERYTLETKLRQKHISREQYDELMIAQDNKCAICDKPETVVRRKDGVVSPLSIDHDHDSGKIRGLLCMRCNNALGFFDDNLDRMMKAVTYLRMSIDGNNDSECPANTCENSG